MGEISLILGGAKSGKTSLALASCEQLPPPRLYLATAEPKDDEMMARINRHKAERGPEWRTVEEPMDPAAVLESLDLSRTSVVLLDCLTLWLSNLMAGAGLGVDEAVSRTKGLARAAINVPCPVIIVSNDVGGGIVPDNKLTRDFRDAAGMAHQTLARVATEVLLVTAGLAQRLK